VTPAAGDSTATRTKYGPFLNFRGLQHAPINEQGVVFLFGIVAFDLGYVVEGIGTGYPDCEAKRSIGRDGDVWERVRIEFEYKSRHFRDHGHDPGRGTGALATPTCRTDPVTRKIGEIQEVRIVLDQPATELSENVRPTAETVRVNRIADTTDLSQPRPTSRRAASSPVAVA
jgi:hypothetical protein